MELFKQMSGSQLAEFYKGVRSTEQITSCPYCGTAEVKERRQRDKHCSGLWNTSVQFRCSAQFEFSPNLMRIEQRYQCNESPEWKGRIKKVDEMRDKLYEFAVANEVHEIDLEKLKRILEGWNPRWF